MKRKMIVSTLAIALGGLLVATVSSADGKHHQFSHFKPIAESANSTAWNPAAPWLLPKGFRQRVVTDENALNIYDGGRNDWHDMNTLNETGKQAGRFLYTTHELRFPDNQPGGGAVSVTDLHTGTTRILAQDASFDALDGIRWTPWGTVLFAEENEGGRLFEIVLDENDPGTALAVLDRPAVGRIAHEGIDVDKAGNVYVVDEHRGRSVGCSGVVPCGGGIYRFVPDNYGDLSSGALYALKVNGQDGTGQAEWVGPIEPSIARESGTAFGAQSYQRPEDLEVVGNTLYVAVTEGPRDETGKELYDGRVLSIDLDTLRVSNFIKPGVNVPVEIGKPGQAGFQSGFDNVDNLAETPDGNLMIVEDNVPSDIWVASTRSNTFGASESVRLFASLTDPDAEGTGIYFSPTDPSTLYVNVQHSAAADGDATWAITRRRHHGDDE